MKKNYKKNIVKLLSDLVAIDSSYPPGYSKNLNNYIFKYLKNTKLKVQLKGKDKNKPNIIAKNYQGNQKSIVFNSHIDTVKPNLTDWKTNPYKLKKINSYLHGLGSVNCKGSAAVQLYIAHELHNLFPNLKTNLCFTFVTDEENLGPDGSLYLRKKKLINPHTLILGAPTNNNFVTEERGVFWATVILKGQTAHAGEPHKGINAIEKANNIIFKLNNLYKKKITKNNYKNQRSTMNIGLFHGGENANVVPSHAEFKIDRRITKKETVKKSFLHLKNFIKRIDNSAKVVFDTGTNSFSSNKNNLYLENLSKSFKEVYKKNPKFLPSIGVSDGRYFADDNINIINIGPGDGNEGHKSNEKMKENELFEYFEIIYNFIKEIDKTNRNN